CYLEPRSGLALRAFDLLREGVLALPQSFGDVLDRASPVGGLALELVECLGQRLLRSLLELFSKTDRRGSLLVDRGPEFARLGLDPGRDVGDALALVVLDGRHLTFERSLRAFEVCLPGMQALFDAPLHRV